MDNSNWSGSDEPIFNIGAVTRTTGIPVATLHAWERRYGFPISMRTPGGHRLYSQAVIQQLLQVKSRIDQGMQTRHAIKLVQNNFSKVAAQSNLQLDEFGKQSQPSIQVDPTNFVNALLEQNIQRADQILGDLLAVCSPEELTLQVIGPALHEIGENWAVDKISITEEHLITNYLRHRLLMWMNTGPRPKSNAPIMLACAPGEWHEGSLLMLGVLLSRQGWPLIYLGQNINLKDMATYIQKKDPLAVVLIAMRSETAIELLDWPKWVHQDSGRPIMAYGGKAFNDDPSLFKKVPGIYLGSSIQAGVDRLNSLLSDYLSKSSGI